MLKKLIVIFGLAIIVQFISGCVDCNCGPIRKIPYTKKGIVLNNLDAALPQPKITATGVIASTNYGIQVRVLIDHLAFNKPSIKLGLMSTAQACSCAEDQFLPKEDISKVEIFSNNDFDATHPKNTDLSLYFKVKNYNLTSLAEHVKLLKEYKNMAREAFYQGVYLQVKPESSFKHKFRLKITLSDGRVLESETSEVELT